MKKRIKIFLITVLSVLLTVVLVVFGYVGYLFLDYERLPDHLNLYVSDGSEQKVTKGETLTVVSYNIGFGAYESDYGFFMDGGSQSWAWSKERLVKNLENIESLLVNEGADFLFLQEVDEDATRSYHVNERTFFTEAFAETDAVWAENWNSSFLLYPFNQPHGSTKAGLLTISNRNISSAVRRSLPIETGVTKFVDLDRCYSKSEVELTESDRQLVLYNVHLSAYTSDGKIAVEQLELLIEDMQGEYQKGNYVVCGGDFNKDLLGDSSKYFGISGEGYTWAQSFPTELLEGKGLTLFVGSDEETLIPSCRNADGPYYEGQFVITVDGFVVSKNIKVEKTEVIDTGFAFSDHNPVKMTFVLE